MKCGWVTAMGFAGAALMAQPAQAAGFFDDFARAFLGRQGPVQAQPQISSVPLEMTVAPRRKTPKYSETSSKPPPPVVKLDPATDPSWYLGDPTLRRGDIVVTESGVLVYQGRDSDALKRSDFTALAGGSKAGAGKAGGKPNWQQQLQQAAAGGRSFFRYDTPATAIVAASDPATTTTR